ncbi:serine hydrolase domain-containing protein [Microbacterium sp. No. 7]|uniref:serine hydrolase domain-containing protein n=1 Tax=Microbacterium sp. No. 7 TaxID=1714373 RepID=UPI0006CF2433|nr:serine hydrolase domain-containing protein [Microbacterium sp. No. 7]ALJ21993.1 hypothetical protein AOA12_19685 [Microbacterium sp. No. 7]
MVTVRIADARLDAVAERFAAFVAAGEEPGASLSVWRGGRPLLEAWGGHRDAARTAPWTADTLAMTYSVGKPLAALGALLAVRAGQVTLDDPVTTWWPAYGAHGKRATTLRHVLSHTAAVPAFPASVAGADPLDKEALTSALAAAEPIGVPGTVIAEHALTYGHLIDGVLAAAGAPSVREAVAGLGSRLGADLWFGVPDERLADVADLEITTTAWVEPYLERDLPRRALTVPRGRLDPAHTNSADARRASFPADGLFTSASALARFYDDASRSTGVVAGMLGEELWREYLRAQATGEDAFVGGEASWSLGFRVDPGEFGMGGLGGSCAWHSFTDDYSFAYVTRGLGTFDRVDALEPLVNAALGAG